MGKNKNNKNNKVSPQPVLKQEIPLVETPYNQPSPLDFPKVLQEPQLEQKAGSSKCKRCILIS